MTADASGATEPRVPPARLPLAMVVAMTPNRVIGRDNRIPWDLPEDRKHFVHVTRGHAVIMGRLTWESIGRPLPKRRNIVVTRNRDLTLDGAETASSLEAAIALARQTDDEPRVMGGAQLYGQALPLTTRLYLTLIDEDVPGDSLFPELNAAEWRVVEERRGDRALYRTLDRVLGRVFKLPTE